MVSAKGSMDDQRSSDQRHSRTGAALAVVVSLLVALLLLASAASAPVEPVGIGIETASWPLDRTPPDEAQLATGRLDGVFVADAIPARSIVPHEARMHWRRIVPTAPWAEASPPVLALYAPYFNRVHVLAPPDYAPRALSLRDPDFDSDRSRHALLVALPPDWDATQPVYLALEPSRRLPVRMRIESRANFATADIEHLRIVLPLLSVLAFITVIVAAFGLVLRERELLFLAGALCAMLFFQGTILGEFYALPGGDRLAATGFRAVWTARASQEAFLVLFAISFLGARRRTPRLAKALFAVAIALFIVAVLAWLPLGSYLGWLSRTGSALLAGAVALMLATALFAWRRGSREARFFLLAWVPLLVLDASRELELLGFVRLYPDNEYLPLVAATWAAGLFAFGIADRLVRVRRERDAAVDAAEHDSLTRVLNRAGILERLRRACVDRRRTVAILFVDLDHFKSVNDRFGHAVGDACLNAVAEVVSLELRQGDSVGRIGGEEFMIVMPDCSGSEAQVIAERVRASVERSCHAIEGHAVGLTLSIGVAATDAGIDHGQLLPSADAAMYQAKLRGRNRVCAEETGTAPA